MYYETTKKIYIELGKKYNMKYRDIADICRAPLEFVADVMKNKCSVEDNYFPSIRITNFGVFFVEPRKKKYMATDEYKQKRDGYRKRKDESRRLRLLAKSNATGEGGVEADIPEQV